MVSGDDEFIFLGSITRLGPGLVHSSAWYSLVSLGLCACYVLETSAGPVVSGWVSSQMAERVEIQWKKYTTNRTCVSN